jgi:hypothetical protein
MPLTKRAGETDASSIRVQRMSDSLWSVTPAPNASS